MIHSDFIKNLPEDEACLLYAVTEHVFSCMGLQSQGKWINMIRPGVMAHLIRNIKNLKDEYRDMANSLASKLEAYTT